MAKTALEKINLDDVKLYTRNDPDCMLARIKELRIQFAQAWQASMKFTLPAGYLNINKILILGMGGSILAATLYICRMR